MNVHELAGYQHFSFPGIIELFTVSWEKITHTISLFRKGNLMYEATENSDAGWLAEFGFDEPALTILTIGKSPREIVAFRKEVLSAVQQNHIALVETICEIVHTTENRSLDSKAKTALKDDLDARFNRLIRELENHGKSLTECDTALSQFFSRRLSDNKTPQQSACV